MFVPERFVIKIDDDVMPFDRLGIANYVHTAMNEDVIVGLGGPMTTLTTPICGINARVSPFAYRPDHVRLVVLFDTQACKIMNRFRWYTLLHAEDVALSVGNRMECGTRSVLKSFAVREYQRDSHSHALDPAFRRAAGNENVMSLYRRSYCHNIRGGYQPVLWSNFTNSMPIDLRLPY
jgi:hypothetical protein